jgi:hypothetical protein
MLSIGNGCGFFLGACETNKDYFQLALYSFDRIQKIAMDGWDVDTFRFEKSSERRNPKRSWLRFWNLQSRR